MVEWDAVGKTYWGVADFPFCLGGTPSTSGETLEIRSPYDNSLVGRTWLAGDAEFDQAADLAVSAAPAMRKLPVYRRAEILMAASAELRARRDDIARILSAEAGKPIKDATVETERAAMTFHVAAEEARRIGGEVVPMDLAPHGDGRIAVVTRVPVGPVAAISPFNFPLNLSAHKIAPAIAAGNPLVLKPATKTPLVGPDPRRHRGPCRLAAQAGSACCRCRARSVTDWSPMHDSSSSPSPARRPSVGT